MVKSRAIIAFSLILLCLIISSVVYLKPVKAQHQGDITINADGSITPLSAPIVQSGNAYSLKSDINGSITVNKSNIVLEGNKHTITVPSVFSTGITITDSSNCTVTNFAIIGGQYGINIYGMLNVIANNSISSVNNGIYSLDEPTGGIILSGPSNAISGNTIANCLVGINFVGGIPNENCSANLVIVNTLTDCSTAFLFYDSSNNTIYHNNLIANTNAVVDSGLGQYPQVVSANTWDIGYPSGGNYWSDYKTKYFNIQEIDSSGIGNIPYVINSNNTDHYPLLQPFSITSTMGKVITSPTPTQIPTATPTVPEFSWLAILPLFISMLSVAVIIGLRKKGFSAKASKQKS